MRTWLATGWRAAKQSISLWELLRYTGGLGSLELRPSRLHQQTGRLHHNFTKHNAFWVPTQSSAFSAGVSAVAGVLG